MNNRPFTVATPEVERADWFKSSYSNNGGDCFEAADLTRTRFKGIAYRDSKNPDGPALLLDHEQHETFISAVRSGHFDS